MTLCAPSHPPRRKRQPIAVPGSDAPPPRSLAAGQSNSVGCGTTPDPAAQPLFATADLPVLFLAAGAAGAWWSAAAPAVAYAQEQWAKIASTQVCGTRRGGAPAPACAAARA